MRTKQYPTQEYLNSLFDYRDGKLYWKFKKSNNVNLEVEAGYFRQGYLTVRIDKANYQVHRIIWIIINGDINLENIVDHINRNKLDNRIENLRCVNSYINALNKNSKNVRFRSDNKKNPYQAQVKIDGKCLTRYFSSMQQAVEWVNQTKSKVFEGFSKEIENGK
jgi:excinuclease UvrABC ATPase subunit